MKVLVLTNFGMGIYKFRKEILTELVTSGFDTMVVFPEDKYVEKIEEIGCKHVSVELERRGMNPFSDLKLLFSYYWLIKEEEPSIVLTYTIKPNIYGGIICRVLKVPYLTNVTGLGTSVEGGGILSKLSLFLYKLGIKKANKVFFQNLVNKEFFENNKIVSDNSILLPGSGVNLKEYQFKNYPDEKKIIRFLYIGRLMKSKGTFELLESIKEIKQYYEDVEFHIVGFSEEDFSEEINKLSQDNKIIYHGEQEDIHPFIKECHAIINPSYHEGMSNVLLEAAASGRPILASNIPGCREIFDEGISGFGFEPQNSDSLITAIEKFIKLPYEQKKQMAIFSREKVEKEFDRQIIVNEYMKEINKLTEENSK